MEEVLVVEIIAAVKQLFVLYLQLQGKQQITLEELKTKTPEELLADLGINVDQLRAQRKIE